MEYSTIEDESVCYVEDIDPQLAKITYLYDDLGDCFTCQKSSLDNVCQAMNQVFYSKGYLPEFWASLINEHKRVSENVDILLAEMILGNHPSKRYQTLNSFNWIIKNNDSPIKLKSIAIRIFDDCVHAILDDPLLADKVFFKAWDNLMISWIKVK